MSKQFYVEQFSFNVKNCSISNNLILHTYGVYMSKKFYFKQFSLAYEYILVLFNP